MMYVCVTVSVRTWRKLFLETSLEVSESKSRKQKKTHSFAFSSCCFLVYESERENRERVSVCDRVGKCLCVDEE